MSEHDAIEKGLKHLAGSEEIIGNIVAYCVNAHKADPSENTMNKIRQYVTDTANSVCGHVLTIAHNINSIIDKESKEIEEMSYQISYAQHRLKSHQTYMSQLYMTKFQTLPRPKPTIHILRETIPSSVHFISCIALYIACKITKLQNFVVALCFYHPCT